VLHEREHALDAGVHHDISDHCFFEFDKLDFLGLFSVFFGGASDGWCSSVSFGHVHLRSLWQDCSPAFHSLFGSEAVEFILSGYSDCVDVFGVRR